MEVLKLSGVSVLLETDGYMVVVIYFIFLDSQ